MINRKIQAKLAGCSNQKSFLPPCGGPMEETAGGGRRRSTQPNGSCNREGDEGEEGEEVRTRERGRPSGQERSILNAVPGSAAEAGAGAAIRAPGAGGGATETGLAGARQRRSAAGWVSEATYSTVRDAINRAVALSEKAPIMSCRICCLNVRKLQNCLLADGSLKQEHFVQDLADLCVRY